MFKASIFLVAAALITLAYGWVSGIDAVLYASIAFSAVAGLALLASTIADRKKYPREQPRREPRPPSREAPSAFGESPPPPPRRPVRPEPRYPQQPEPTFHWSEEEEVASGFGGRDVDQPAGSPGSEDFRSRLAAALAATDDESPPRRTDPRPTPPRAERRQKTAPPPPSSQKPGVETEEVEQDWIRIDDLPGMSDVPPATGRLSPARKPRKPTVAEPTGTGRARVRWPPEPEPNETPVGDEPAPEERGPEGQGDESLRPRTRPRQRP